MRFGEREILANPSLKDRGLPWQPGPDYFGFDEAGITEQPFQPRVYFILDLKQFLRWSRTVEQLKTAMFRLPMWHDAWGSMRSMAVTDVSVVDGPRHDRSVESGSELLTLYRLLSARLVQGQADARITENHP